MFDKKIIFRIENILNSFKFQNNGRKLKWLYHPMIEEELVKNMNYDNILNKFASKKGIRE